MSTLERIREILVTLSPEQREEVMRFVKSVAEPSQKTVTGAESSERKPSENEPSREVSGD